MSIEVKWNSHLFPESEGVIVGCNQNQEWLLPWWWMHFRLYNNQPVTFINFGDMSNKALDWCKAHADVISLDVPNTFIALKEKVDPLTADKWQKMHSGIWTARASWFLKPFVMLKSPYLRTVWMDLDCQIRGSIQPLFSKCLNEAGIAIAAELPYFQLDSLKLGHLVPGEVMYNTGVLVFNRRSKIIEEWARTTLDQNHLFYGDQHLLSRLLFLQKPQFTVLPYIYNWPIEMGFNQQAIIIHWYARFRLKVIEQIQVLQKFFYINLSLDILKENEKSN